MCWATTTKRGRNVYWCVTAFWKVQSDMAYMVEIKLLYFRSLFFTASRMQDPRVSEKQKIKKSGLRLNVVFTGYSNTISLRAVTRPGHILCL